MEDAPAHREHHAPPAKRIKAGGKDDIADLTKRQKLEEARPPETWLKVGQSSMVGTKWCCSGTSLGYFLQGSSWHSVAKFCSSSDTIWWKGTIWNLGASVSAVMAVFGPQTAKGGGSKVYQSGLVGHKHEVNSSK